MQSARLAEKAFQRKLADGLGRATCRKQQERDGVFLLARLFGNRCMVSKRGREGKRWKEGKNERMKGGEADIRISFSSPDPSPSPSFSWLGGENVMDDCGCSSAFGSHKLCRKSSLASHFRSLVAVSFDVAVGQRWRNYCGITGMCICPVGFDLIFIFGWRDRKADRYSSRGDR